MSSTSPLVVEELTPSATFCSSPCTGNSSLICGGQFGRISVYNKVGEAQIAFHNKSIPYNSQPCYTIPWHKLSIPRWWHLGPLAWAFTSRTLLRRMWDETPLTTQTAMCSKSRILPLKLQLPLQAIQQQQLVAMAQLHSLQLQQQQLQLLDQQPPRLELQLPLQSVEMVELLRRRRLAGWVLARVDLQGPLPHTRN